MGQCLRTQPTTPRSPVTRTQTPELATAALAPAPARRLQGTHTLAMLPQAPAAAPRRKTPITQPPVPRRVTTGRTAKAAITPAPAQTQAPLQSIAPLRPLMTRPSLSSLIS